jgi:hypothetical protein
MRKIELNENNFQMLKQECIDFIENIEDIDDRTNYALELQFSKSWKSFIKSDIFSTCIGSIIQQNDEYIIIIDD